MKLDRLAITLSDYGPNNGKFIGSCSFKGQYGEVSIVLSPSISNTVLKLCADALVENAKDVAQNLTAEIIENSGQPALAHKPEAIDV